MSRQFAWDLALGVGLVPPRTAYGIYLDRRDGHEDVHMRFVYKPPDRWVWLHVEEPAAGAITDGTTNVIIDDGVAVVVTEEGKVGTTHRLVNLFNPRNYDSRGWVYGEVVPATAIGRDAWVTQATPQIPGKRPQEIAFDRSSGVILYMRADDNNYLGFESLTLDAPLDAGTFRWNGPVQPRRYGEAIVYPDQDGGYSAVWEIYVRDRYVFGHSAPAGMEREDAVAWAEHRAATTTVRSDS